MLQLGKVMVMNDTAKSADPRDKSRRRKIATADCEEYADAVSEGWPVASAPPAKAGKTAVTTVRKPRLPT